MSNGKKMKKLKRPRRSPARERSRPVEDIIGAALELFHRDGEDAFSEHVKQCRRVRVEESIAHIKERAVAAHNIPKEDEDLSRIRAHRAKLARKIDALVEGMVELGRKIDAIVPKDRSRPLSLQRIMPNAPTAAEMITYLDFGQGSGTFDVAAGTITNAAWSGTSNFTQLGYFYLSFGTPPGDGTLSYSFVGHGGGGAGELSATYTNVSAAPGPIPGAGLLSYIALAMLGLGSAGWKRWRRRSQNALR
jgi:hypothetical protein